MWYHEFSNPMYVFPSPCGSHEAHDGASVATLDVLRSPKRENPFVLVQPQPRLQEILPSVDLTSAAKHKRLPNLDAAYVGLVEETGSLYAMSPDRFPLVVFGDSNEDNARHLRSIDPPPGSAFDPTYDYDKDFPADVDSVTRIAKAKRLREMCKNGVQDVRCLTGVRKLGSDSQSRLSRLLDGAPSVIPPPPPPYSNSNNVEMPAEPRIPDSQAPDTGNASVRPPPAWSNASETPRLEDRSAAGLLGMSPSTQAFSAFALCATVLLLWMSVRKFLASSIPAAVQVSVPAPPPEVSDVTTKPVEAPSFPADPSEKVANGHAEPPAEELQTPSPESSPVLAKKVLFAPDALEPIEDAADGEDTEKDADAADTPGKRKNIRRKRGRKKNKGVTIVVPADEVEEVAEAIPEPRKEPAPTILLAPPTPSAPAAPTLVVSDSVLGRCPSRGHGRVHSWR